MAEIFDRHGYLTAAFTGSGAISARFGFYKGFDFYNETSNEETGGDLERILEKATPWISANANRSFFLFLHTYEPHVPYTDDFFVNKESIDEADTLAYRTAKYDGDIRRADWFFGEILATLRAMNSTRGDHRHCNIGPRRGPR